jgi:hypothetical protein
MEIQRRGWLLVSITRRRVIESWRQGVHLRVFALTNRASRSWNDKLRLREPRSPVNDLSRYSRSPEQDHYRHRMLMNLLAFLVLSLLVCSGIWLTDNISPRAKVRDCVLIDRTNCAPIPLRSNTR